MGITLHEFNKLNITFSDKVKEHISKRNKIYGILEREKFRVENSLKLKEIANKLFQFIKDDIVLTDLDFFIKDSIETKNNRYFICNIYELKVFQKSENTFKIVFDFYGNYKFTYIFSK